MKKLLLFLSAFTVLMPAMAQMTVDNALTVEQYVQQVLLGDNVTVSNITFNTGSAAVSSTAVGGFDCVDCNMSIPSGFLMSSGDAVGAIGPNDETSHSGPGTGGFAGTDADLVSLVQSNGGNSVNDWVIIEFDFVPLGDTLRFNYVWASEEYDFYANSGFNDVFGFFISGPGIAGTYTNNAENIALVPGSTTLGVGINSINNGSGNAGLCMNCEYYNQDSDPDSSFPWPSDPDAPWFNDGHYMQYDGYTDVLTAIAIVQCGLTYHIKLAVCDANDSGFDSAVFLQRDSFSSNLVVQASLQLDVAGPDGQTLFENCGDGNLVFTRPISGDINQELVAYLGYGGTAVNGVDYTLLPDSVTFPPGQMTVSLYIDAFADGLAEGVESVNIAIENIADCGEGLLTSEFNFVISDIADPLVVEGVDTEICQGGTATLEPIITGGYAAYHYDWSTGESTETVDVSPANTTTYLLTVSDTCGMPSDDAQFIVTVLQTPVLLVDLVDQDNLLPMNCDSWGGSLYANAQGGIEPYTYTFTDDQGFNLWGWNNTVSISTWNAGMVYVEVQDHCGFTVSDSLEVTVNAPEMFLTVPPIVNAPCGQAFDVTAVATGGYLSWGYSYTWDLNGQPAWQWTETYFGTADAPQTLTVHVSDNCGQTLDADVQVTVESPAINLVMNDSEVGTCTTVFNLGPELSGGSGVLNQWVYTWTENGIVIGNGATLNSTFPNNTTVSFNVVDVCGATASDEVQINIVNPEISVSLGEDVNTSCISTTNLTANFAGGSGGVDYQWSVAGAPIANTLSTYSLQTFETLNVDVTVTDFCGMTATDQVAIIIPNVPLTMLVAPEVMICPGDSVNVWALAGGGEGGFSYDWSNDNNQPTFTIHPDVSQILTVTAEDICGKQITGEMHISVNPITASFNTQPLGENLYLFEAAPIPACVGCEMVWDFGDGDMSFEANPTHQFDGLNEYTVTFTITNEIGCMDEGTFPIIPPPSFYIPSAFTPNGDGLNDVFQVVANSVLEYELHIFNRWGDEVFSSTDTKDVWLGDTKDHGDYFVGNGIYNYVVRVKGFNSETYKSKGSITILR